MGLINWMFDIYQHTQIETARREAEEARREVSNLRASGGSGSVDAQRVEDALGEIALAIKALQRMMVERGVCTSAEFAQKLREIDAEDGEIDGKSPLPLA